MIVILIDLNLQDISARRYSKLYRTEGGMGRHEKNVDIVFSELDHCPYVGWLVWV